mmetsp:Transcript_102545/g.306351  ORF Transcript_102545/g.306351 Transcript_102545/m.306351 type:complete len:340 (-) Transcript_102545:501-1520(-)
MPKHLRSSARRSSLRQQEHHVLLRRAANVREHLVERRASGPVELCTASNHAGGHRGGQGGVAGLERHGGFRGALDCRKIQKAVACSVPNRSQEVPRSLRDGLLGSLRDGSRRGPHRIPLHQQGQRVERRDRVLDVELGPGGVHPVRNLPQVVAVEGDLPPRIRAEQAHDLARLEQREAGDRSQADVAEDLPQVAQVRDLRNLEALPECEGRRREAAGIHRRALLAAVEDAGAEEVVHGARDAHAGVHEPCQLQRRSLRQRLHRAIREAAHRGGVCAAHSRERAHDDGQVADMESLIAHAALNVRDEPPVQLLVCDPKLAHSVHDHREFHGRVELQQTGL